METGNLLPQFVEFVALVYHEGRHVQRLFHFNAASKNTFGKLAELPTDDNAAWQKLIPIQQHLAAVEGGKQVRDGFAEEFGCSLDDLHGMFENPAWKRLPQFGGPRWALITKAVIDLGDAIDRKDDAAAESLLQNIPALRHNTGTVEHKLARLKARPK